MSDFVIRSWFEPSHMWHVLQLRRDEQFVELHLTEEELVGARFAHLVVEDAMHRLSEAWQRKYGTQVFMRKPQAEAEQWTAHDGDYVEGEVIGERRAIDAPRKAIEGR